ncbi:hypothetical protein QBC35DRAFT_9485 [Podospora australis]|uniref:Nitrate reductase n=1 Tax=Podospora australis TaxID=1536484 RepID=A0AAN7ANS4_9PEZI|nr:hypothetical protein QBC35DRAFT_9485 [Podospora australis]
MEVASSPAPPLDGTTLTFQIKEVQSDSVPRSFYEYDKDGLVISPPELAEDDLESSTSQSQSSSSPSQPSTPLYPLPPTPRQNLVLPEDLKTPDNHVERDPRLIRLTGVHPFNVEAPLKDLYDEGFLTTKDLHYVRNHGPVPQVLDSEVLDWEFTVEGMVEHPIKLTLRQLIQDYEQVTYPITLVCAGNRRKEQNVVRKTKGFSWGAAGLSTALWTGVSLGDLLSRAVPKRGAKYVCFEGADKLPNGYYGTSVKLNWAMDSERGMMVSYKMNGEILHPDHGKPLRIVIPGQIGGRSVKWLKRIIVTAAPSDNWYHIYDNRVLPTMISPEASADVPDTWKDERYAIYDLNTNSATCYPAHNERVSLAEETYTFKGYAYAGGGKRVTRLEVTLDQGKTWLLANISYPEDRYRNAPDGETLYGGKVDLTWREASFCWCFWDLSLPLSALQNAKDVLIRAMDDSMMVQPRDMYWSVLGMMNNPWYRVVIHKDAHSNSLWFEHPTQPALLPGGWMERVKKEGGNLTNGFWGEKVSGDESETVAEEPAKEICMMDPAALSREISLEEFRAHDGEEEPWFIVNGQVYDGTKFLEGHPGGAASIINAAAQDISEEFLAIHSENAKAMMPSYHIGYLPPSSLSLLNSPSSPSSSSGSSSPSPLFLHPKKWLHASLSQKTKVSSDTKIFSFSLSSPSQAIGLPVGQHLLVRLRDPVSREAIIRAYTPLSPGSQTGTLDLLVKIYYDSPSMSGGKMTQALDSLPLGHPVEFKGPVGKFEYLSAGKCALNGKERQVKKFIMVCAGSGITPIFQVLRAVLAEPIGPECLVLDGNRVEEDILCKPALDKMAAENPDRCKVLYSLSRPEASWTGRKGRMDKSFFEQEVGAPEEKGRTMVLVCGPHGLERLVEETLRGLGWGEEDVVFF